MGDIARREEWLRDVDGSGSMHPCFPSDPGAVEYVPAARLTAAEYEASRLRQELDGVLKMIGDVEEPKP
jgi:hypothetical protein